MDRRIGVENGLCFWYFWVYIGWLSMQTTAFGFMCWNAAALPEVSNGYIRVDCYGGLNQMRRDVSTRHHCFFLFFVRENFDCHYVTTLWCLWWFLVMRWCWDCSFVKCNPCIAKVWSGSLLEWIEVAFLF